MITGKFLTSRDDTSLVMDIRKRVFVDEQGYSLEGERDWHDDMAIYALTFDENGTPGATGRLYMDDDNVATIGRVCTIKSLRGQGLGDLVMRMLLYRVLEMNLPRVKLSSQLPVQGFYARYGLKPYGDVFLDEGVPHIMMAADNADINIEGSCKHCPAAQDENS